MKPRGKFQHARRGPQSLRFEQLETRTLMSATPFEPMPSASDVPLAAVVDGALAQLTDRIGPVTDEEYQMLIGNRSDFTVTSSSYGGDPPLNTAPTTTGIDDVTIEEDGTFSPVPWSTYFSDPDEGDTLSYAEVANTDSSVATVNCGGTGLTVIPGENTSGITDITIRATDSGGLWVEATFRVTVTAVDDPPEITEFTGYGGSGDFWMFSGSVTDVDSDVEGMVVTFGGVLAGYNLSATVQSDGSFGVSEELSGVSSGIATAQTGGSNVAEFWVVS